MQHRNLREDALEDTAASLRMANGILRELVDAGAVDGDPADLARLLAVTYDEIVGMSLDLTGMDAEPGTESSPAPFNAGESCDTADAARILRLTEKRLEALARLIEEAVDQPFLID